MTTWEAFLLGIVQGITEFLPVSSSGHLVMTQAVLGIEVPGVVFEVVVHLATLASILVVYRTRIAKLSYGVFSGDRDALRYVGYLVLATIPAAVIGLLWKDRIEGLFESPTAVGIALLITGTFLWSSRSALRRMGDAGAHPMAWSAALIGLAQAFALAPGISRSGSTVVMALWLGIEIREAAAFSFLMAIPAIAGAAVLELPELGSAGGPSGGALLVGGVAAAVMGILAIRTFVAMLARRSFHLFAPYCWTVGVLFLAFVALR